MVWWADEDEDDCCGATSSGCGSAGSFRSAEVWAALWSRDGAEAELVVAALFVVRGRLGGFCVGEVDLLYPPERVLCFFSAGGRAVAVGWTFLVEGRGGVGGRILVYCCNWRCEAAFAALWSCW